MAEVSVDYMGLIAPWLPQPIVDLWIEYYDEIGTQQGAWEAVRQDDLYEQYFPGNVRDDGSIRLDEEEYVATVEDYEATLIGAGVEPSFFREKFPDLIAGDVHPDEFEFRVNALYENIIMAAPEVKAWYAQNYGLDLTNEAILAAALDPQGVGNALLTKQITIGQVGGAGAMRALEVSGELASKLYDWGIDTTQEAGELFGMAQGMLPILNTLAKRHNDPDDDFNLEDFVHAEIMNDPEQRRRMSRLVAQERSSFRIGRGARLDQRTGGLTGLSTL